MPRLPINVDIGSVVRNARAFNPKHWRNGAGPMDDLLNAVDRLFSLLEERRTDYVLVGGIALLSYVEGRNTEGIELIIATATLASIPELVIQDVNEDFAKAEFQGLRVDLLLTRNRLFDRVQRENRATLRFKEREIPCATPEGLLLLKLYALPAHYREGDFSRVNFYESDIAALLEAARPNLPGVFAVLSKYMLATDLEAVH